MANCHLKERNLNRLTSFRSTIDNSVLEGNKEVRKARQAINEANLSFKSLNYLIDVYKKISVDPIYGKLFTADLFTILNNVKPDLGEYKVTLSNHLKKLSAEIEKAKRHRSNLNNNIDVLRELMCRVEGVYRLKVNNETLKLVISKSGSSYIGSYNETLSFIIPKGIKVNGPNLSFQGVYEYWDGFRYCCPSYYDFTAQLDRSFKKITVKNLKANRTYILSK